MKIAKLLLTSSMVFQMALTAGCAADVSNPGESLEQTGQAVVESTDPVKLAVEAFLADGNVRRALGDKHSVPQVAFLKGVSGFDNATNKYVVVAFKKLHRRPGAADFPTESLVTAIVTIQTLFGQTKVFDVKLAKIEDAPNSVENASTASAAELSARAAIKAYNNDPTVKALVEEHRASRATAVVIHNGTGHSLIAKQYLVISTYDSTPPGRMDAYTRTPIAAMVSFFHGGVSKVGVQLAEVK